MIGKNIKLLLLFFLYAAGLSVLYAEEEPRLELFSYPLKVVVYRETGNFCVYYADSTKQNKYAPLYNDKVDRKSCIYSVLVDKTIYPLKSTDKNKVIIEQMAEKIVISFQINFDFAVTQTHSFIESHEYSVGKVLKIETEVKNTSGKTVEIGLKALFDVLLGEDKKVPLYTDLRSEIGSELILRPELEKDRAIFSGSEDAACMFFLKHEKMTEPSSVHCANRKRLAKNGWLPHYASGRSFKRFGSRDVGVLYVWPTETIPYKKTFRIINCIGFYDYRRSVNALPFGTGTTVITPAAKESASEAKAKHKPEPADAEKKADPDAKAPVESELEKDAAPKNEPEPTDAEKKSDLDAKAPVESELEKDAAPKNEPEPADAEKKSDPDAKAPVESELEKDAAPKNEPESAGAEKKSDPETKTPATVPPEKQPSKKDAAYVKELLDKIRQIEQSASDMTVEQIREVTKEADNAIMRMQEK